MKNRAVTFRKEAALGIITLNRPDLKNAISLEMAEALSEIRNEIGYGSEIAVLLITGEGSEAFCIGTDAAEYSSYENREEFISRHQTASIVDSFDRPIIAAINGDALGQGLELILACDIRIATETARFAMTHVNRGEVPWDGGTQRLSRLIGRGKALEMILLGETIDAVEALRIGLVNRVVTVEELMPAALKVARELSNKGPISLRYAKEAINKGMDMTLEQGLRLEADLYFLLHTTDDRTEGIKAFQEKRSPRFHGK